MSVVKKILALLLLSALCIGLSGCTICADDFVGIIEYLNKNAIEQDTISNDVYTHDAETIVVPGGSGRNETEKMPAL